MSQETIQRERARQKRRLERQKPKTTRILARYRYNVHKWVEVEETDTFENLWAKYKDKRDVEFYCADIPPRLDENGNYTTEQSYRLSEHNLNSFGKHKAWIDPELSKLAGKKIVLVFNAA